ncbi:UNVERIFIED_ORG: choline dehydrogenase-like flavoprotein [Xanthobacter viscosus]|uniref:GMC family oxidoreductase n=1 Tax=Xanthobacter autotrophicus TaxID=280 RepID=A0A6C1KAG0_XANAU|nr:GMC family oxidoreductase [Xanthobacter autotrophicus]TLX40741.1 GMC family oxidoreductase [Xanthobacter autotrophicus]
MAEAAHCDVIVVGTGAGGGILAYELAKAGLNVVSLEQGGQLADDHFKRVDPPGTALDFGIRSNTVWPAEPHDSLFVHPLFEKGEDGSTGWPEGGFRHYQIIQVNGLQNLWNGVSVRFSEKDFADWPFRYAELAPHYDAVERRIVVCGTTEDIPELPDGIYVPPKPLRPADQMIVDAVNGLEEPHSRAIPNRKAIDTRPDSPNACASTGICTSGCPTGAVYKFTARLLPEIAKLPNYELRTGAKVVRLLREPGSRRVLGVEYRDMATGESRLLTADKVVLATGAIESPRILFNSADDVAPHGMGNAFGQLGLRLQDNPKSVLSTSLWKLWGSGRDFDIGYGDLLILLSRGTLPDGEEFPFIGHAIHGVPDVPHYLVGMKRFPPFMKERLSRFMFHSYVTLGLFCAGDPNPANRVRPAGSYDRFGVRHVTVDFSSSAKADRMMDAMEAWGRTVLRHAGATSIYPSRDNSGTGIHYAGTTAISADPARGVVDANLKCHDLDNVYVCDGGVIPVLPDKHLTLTIMAMAHRLAGHLVEKVRTGAQTTAQPAHA